MAVRRKATGEKAAGVMARSMARDVLRSRACWRRWSGAGQFCRSGCRLMTPALFTLPSRHCRLPPPPPIAPLAACRCSCAPAMLSPSLYSSRHAAYALAAYTTANGAPGTAFSLDAGMVG
jgi:hypothetical protein